MKELKEIAKALVFFQSKMPKIELNSTVNVTTKTGGSYSFKYATLAHTLEVIRPLLKECNIAYTHIMNNDDSITTLLIHAESGECLESNKSLNLPDNATAQEVGSFITYYKRYTLLAMLGIVAEDDDDGNIAGGNKFNKYKFGSAKDDKLPWIKDGQVTAMIKTIPNDKQQVIDKLSAYKWSRANKDLITKALDESEVKA